MPEKFASDFDNVSTFLPTDEFILVQNDVVKNTTWAAMYSAIVDAICPPGKIDIFTASSVNYPPNNVFGGWLDCDGSWVSQSTYNKLFNAIAHTWSRATYSHAGNIITITSLSPHQLAIGDSINLNFLGGSIGPSLAKTVVSTPTEFSFTVNESGASAGASLYFFKPNTFKLPELRGEFLRFWSGVRSNVDPSRELGSFQEGQVGELALPIRTANSTATTSTDLRYFDSKSALQPALSLKSTNTDSFNGTAQTKIDTTSRNLTLLSLKENRVRNVALRACIKY